MWSGRVHDKPAGIRQRSDLANAGGLCGLAGLHRPVGGGMHLQGCDRSEPSAEQIVAHGLVPEGRRVFSELSVRDNIRLFS